MTAPTPDEINVEIRLDTDTVLKLTGYCRAEQPVRNMATRAARAIKGDDWRPLSEQVTVTTYYCAQPERVRRPRAPGELPPKSPCCGAYMVEFGTADGVLFEVSILSWCPHCGKSVDVIEEGTQ